MKDPNAAQKSDKPKLYDAESTDVHCLVAARNEQHAREIVRWQYALKPSVRIRLKQYTKAMTVTDDGDEYYQVKAAEVASRWCGRVVPQE